MRFKVQNALVATLVGLAWLVPSARAGTTNGIGWWDAFESYTNGMPIDGTNGWSAESANMAAVTADTNVTLLLTNYPTLGKSYPLSVTHSNVLQFSTVVRNTVGGGTNGIVKVDFLVLPIQMEAPPPGDTNLQCSFCVSTNARLTIWHYNVPLNTNEWRELANSPTIATNAWSRFTIVSDYSNSLFQMRVNEGDPIADSAGWTSATGVLGGAWFHMVQTNRLLSGFKADGAPAYLDDIVVTNRTLMWSGTGFAETNLNNGRINTNTPFTITLAADTFNGTNNADLIAAGAAVATNVPVGLTALVTRISTTQAVVTCVGAAAQHESANTISNLTIRFTDAAFGFGSAWDVGANQRTNLTVTFFDTPRLSWSTNAFRETAANDGSIDNTNPLLVTLTNGAFNLTLGVDFGADTSKIAFANLPPGLTVEAILTNATQVRVRFLNKATAHAATNSLSNLGVVFQNGAFVTVPATSVFNVGTNLSMTFTDPGTLTYATNVFWETVANNGAVGGTSLSLSNKTFNATNNEDLVASLKVTPANVPGGLTLQVVVTDNQHATLLFAGNATNHTAAYSIRNLGVTFNDTAFTGSNAVDVSNAVRSDLVVQFNDQPAVSMVGGSTFTEAPANNGSIGNTLTVLLTGDTFTSTGFTAGVQYTVSPVPAGLTFGLMRADSTHLTASLTSRATSHSATDSVANLHLTFLNASFSTVAAANVTGYPLDFAVVFTNQPVLTWHGSTFNELAGGVIDNRNPITVTLSGDAFAGTNGQDLAAAGWFALPGLPATLTARATRDSATQVSVTLAGRAARNAASDSVSNLTATFQGSVFAAADADQVTNYRKTDLAVAFVDDTGFFNTIPYAEPFEAYANGTAIDGTNGWTALYDPAAGTVTNDPTVASSVLAYLQNHASLPVGGTHAQELYVQDYIQDAIHSETSRTVYVDFMTWPVPLQAPPDNDTNVQCAFYVSTNSQLVIWHNDRVGGSVNEWMPLTNATSIDTSRWMRLTIAQDYTHGMFQVRVNESQPVADARGWTDGGASQTGSWYYMVQTNGALSGFRMSGVGAGYLDDLTVNTTLPANLGWRYGSVFELR